MLDNQWLLLLLRGTRKKAGKIACSTSYTRKALFFAFLPRKIVRLIFLGVRNDEVRKKCNMVFLRINMAIICWATAALVPAIAFWGKSYKHAIGVAHLMVLIACCVIANVWGKRK